MDEDPREPFFNRQFWRMTLIAAFSQVIVLAIALTASAVIGGKVDKLIELSDSVSETLERVETTINTVTGIDPAVLQEKANALNESAGIVGEGVGDGGAEVVNRIGDAIQKFRENNANE
jgi:hypothetical protein